MIFSIECNCDSLAWLPGAHGVNEKLQRGEIPILDELDRGLVLKIPVGSIEKDANIRLVASVELKQGHPDPIKTAEFSLQAAGIGRLANAGGSPANGLGNMGDKFICFSEPGKCDSEATACRCAIPMARG
jgi:hypothetical protein